MLFSSLATKPLAEALRPASLDDVAGQEHLTGKEAPLTRLIQQQHPASIILWGPPGCGKTTIARLVAEQSNAHFIMVSAVTSGVTELKKHFADAESRHQTGGRTLMMVDEIHRFNRAQQDVFLPYIENGSIIIIGATTENPSFELNGALLSRCKVLTLKRLENSAMEQLLERCEAYMKAPLPLDNEARQLLIHMADGDGRFLFGLCEELYALPAPYSPQHPLTKKALQEFVQARPALYDKSQESHYNLISALHKSLRGSDADAALYWFARMLEGGENPLYIIRRLVRFAVEDIGLADPQAVTQALVAKDSYEFLGSPEGELAIAQAVIYLATAPKSNAAYTAYKQVRSSAKSTGSAPPPKHILNAPTQLMKEEGYGKGYQYDHDTAEGFSGQNYFPDGMDRIGFYQPKPRGFEREIQKRLEYWEKLRKNVASEK